MNLFKSNLVLTVLLSTQLVQGQLITNDKGKISKSTFTNDQDTLIELYEMIKTGHGSEFDGIPFVIPFIEILDKTCKKDLNKIKIDSLLNIENWELNKAISFYEVYPNNSLLHTMGIIIAKPKSLKLKCVGKIVSFFYFVKFFPNNIIQYGIIISGENTREGTIQQEWDHYNKLCHYCGDENVYK